MMRAVICDDEKAALNIIRFFIEQEHMPIEIIGTAENGRQALALIERERPELVFMDIQMPYMNGFEVIRQIRGSQIIVITAFDSFEYAQQALRLGVCDIISKPIDFEQLRQAIERAVGWRFTGNETVDKILTWLYGHYAEKVELKTLSELTFCSESHIARLFRRETGTTIISYVHRIRIEEAQRLLDQGDRSVKEVAEAVGYQNLNHFYRYFEQYTGQTPASWRKGKRGEEL